MSRLKAQGLVTRKGQVTIPAEMRKSLGICEGDRVEFILEDDELQIVRAKSFIERTAGMFHVVGVSRTIEEMKAAAEEGWIEEARAEEAAIREQP